VELVKVFLDKELSAEAIVRITMYPKELTNMLIALLK
jgi:hypothetical protein